MSVTLIAYPTTFFIDSDVNLVTAPYPAEAIDSDTTTVGGLDAKSVIDQRLQGRSCFGHGHMTALVFNLRINE